MAAADFVAGAEGAVMEWQPIETAPISKDILCCVKYEIDGATYNDMWVDSWHEGYGWAVFRRLIHIPFEPTHWMPLPEPPEGA